VEDETSAVFGDHADVDPPLTGYQFCSSDVVNVLITYGAVMCALIVEADPRVVVAHIDECSVLPVGHHDLSSRRRQPIVDEDQPQSRFLGRLRSAVHQRQRDSGTGKTTCPRVSIGEQNHA
jgi:hypothetical protein